MVLKFNPPKQVARYALYVGTESRGKLYTYDDLGSAKNSYHHKYTNVSGAKILENVEGNWYVLYDIPSGTKYKDLPWVKEVEGGGWRSSYKIDTAKPMTRDEYAEWRLQVERERIADLSGDLKLNNL